MESSYQGSGQAPGARYGLSPQSCGASPALHLSVPRDDPGELCGQTGHFAPSWTKRQEQGAVRHGPHVLEKFAGTPECRWGGHLGGCQTHRQM